MTTSPHDPRLERFIQTVGRPVAVTPYGCDDDEAIQYFIWLLDCPRGQLCEIQDRAIELALDIYEDGPLPFIIGVADPEKTKILGLTPACSLPSAT